MCFARIEVIVIRPYSVGLQNGFISSYNGFPLIKFHKLCYTLVICDVLLEVVIVNFVMGFIFEILSSFADVCN